MQLALAIHLSQYGSNRNSINISCIKLLVLPISLSFSSLANTLTLSRTDSHTYTFLSIIVCFLAVLLLLALLFSIRYYTTAAIAANETLCTEKRANSLCFLQLHGRAAAAPGSSIKQASSRR